MHSTSMVGITFCESSFYDIFMMITTKEYPLGFNELKTILEIRNCLGSPDHRCSCNFP